MDLLCSLVSCSSARAAADEIAPDGKFELRAQIFADLGESCDPDNFNAIQIYGIPLGFL